MMERAVAVKKGEAAAPELRTTLNLGLDIRIPPEYISAEALRLRTYKRIAGVSSESDQRAVRAELTDRFGPLPPSVENLLEYAVLKSACERLQISSVERRGQDIAFKFHPTTPVNPKLLVSLIKRLKGSRLDPSGMLAVALDGGKAGIAGTVRNVLLQLEAAD
jgi:transcription-repair coupling factor (superfamily II helicase)